MPTATPEPKVKLVPFSPEHHAFLHDCYAEDPSIFQWLFPFGMPDREILAERVPQSVSHLLVIIEASHQTPIGIAYLYRWRPPDGVAFFSLSFRKDGKGADLGKEAATMFVEHIFSSLNMRKLFIKGCVWQLTTICDAMGSILEEEGCLRDHIYFDGHWHDQLILSVSRERLNAFPASGQLAAGSADAIPEYSSFSTLAERKSDSWSEGEPTSRWLPLGKETRPLVSSRVRLVPAQSSHIKYLYEFATRGGAANRWRFSSGMPTLQEFQRRFHQGVFAQFVPILKRTGQPFGHLLAYQADPSNGHVCIGGATEARLHRTGYPIEAFVILLKYLFVNWNFRKIYVDLPEYNREQILSGTLIDGVHEEARLRDVVFHDGAWWDWSTISISRTFFRDCLGI
jgi:RimJ/RimL family protein N-acetyltransferase